MAETAADEAREETLENLRKKTSEMIAAGIKMLDNGEMKEIGATLSIITQQIREMQKLAADTPEKLEEVAYNDFLSQVQYLTELLVRIEETSPGHIDIQGVLGNLQGRAKSVRDFYFDSNPKAAFSGATLDAVIVKALKQLLQELDDPKGPLSFWAGFREELREPCKVLITRLIDASGSYIRQNPAVNTLTKQNGRRGKIKKDEVMGKATISVDGMDISIANYDSHPEIKVSAWQLLHVLLQEADQDGWKTNSFNMPVEEYMRKRELKDRKEAIKQASEDLEMLFSMKCTYTMNTRINGKPAKYPIMEMRIIDSMPAENERKRGIIAGRLGQTFFELMKGSPIMYYPPQLLKINANRNTHSFFFLKKIAEMKRENSGKKSEDIISVKTLLKESPKMPTYEQVMEKGQHVRQQIIEPFERDMNKLLEETLTEWTYQRKSGEVLGKEEAKKLSYRDFIALNVRVTWKYYPDQIPRLERKAESIKAAEERKKEREKACKKKAPESKTGGSGAVNGG